MSEPHRLQELMEALAALLRVERDLARLLADPAPGFTTQTSVGRLVDLLPDVPDLRDWRNLGLDLEAAVNAHERLARARLRAREFGG